MNRLLLIAAFMLASCARKATPLPTLPVPRAIPVAPEVAKVRESLDRATSTAATVATEHAAAVQKSTELAAESQRLATAGAASQAELSSVAARAADLEGNLTQAERSIDALSADLAAAHAAQAHAEAVANQADATSTVLVDQVTAVTTQFQTARADADALRPQVAVANSKADQFRAWFAWSLWSIAAYLSLRIVKLTPWGKPWLSWFP